MADESAWKGRHVLVTGATGFVGYWLVRQLTDLGAAVYGIIRPVERGGPVAKELEAAGVVWTEAEIDDVEAISLCVTGNGIQTVFHLAAVNVNIGAPSVYDTLRINTGGAWAVLEAARRGATTVQSVVVASSAEVDAAIDPAARKRHPYAVSKAAAEWSAESFWAIHQVPVAVARCDNVYGGGDLNWQRLIPGSIRSLAAGEAMVLRSRGNLVRRYLHVDDMVAAYLHLARRVASGVNRGRILRVAATEGSTAQEIVTRLATLAGRPDLRPRVDDRGEPERVVDSAAGDTVQPLPEWTPRVTLHEGLVRTVEWYARYFAGHGVPPAMGEK